MTAHRLLLILCALTFLFPATAGGAKGYVRIPKEVVPFSGYQSGTVVIKTQERRLYLVLGGAEALRYPVGVGRLGMQWQGSAQIGAKYVKPPWTNGKQGFAGGSPQNAMGAAAMPLTHGNYAIHGTNEPGKIGTFVSHGCIRMYNEDVLDLMSRVRVGTPVVVMK